MHVVVESGVNHIVNMVADPRISDSELAAMNAAAVTREYRVQPHLGASIPLFSRVWQLTTEARSDLVSSRLPHSICYQRVNLYLWKAIYIDSYPDRSPLVVLDNVKVG